MRSSSSRPESRRVCGFGLRRATPASAYYSRIMASESKKNSTRRFSRFSNNSTRAMRERASDWLSSKKPLIGWEEALVWNPNEAKAARLAGNNARFDGGRMINPPILYAEDD